MLSYILRRLAIAIPTLLGISILTFVFINLAPGDPLVRLVANVEGGRSGPMTPEVVERLRQQYGLDRPVPIRYLVWLGEVARGNLGQRYTDGRDVAQVIFGERLGPTLELMSAALVLALLVGVPLGVISALRQYSATDYALTIGAFTGISLPEFFAAILLIYALAVRLHLFPTSGRITAGAPFTLADNLHHLVLPCVVLALSQISVLMRFARSSVLEVKSLEYVTTGRAKGLREASLLRGYVLRNALLPLISVVGMMVPRLIAGSAIVESVFQWPGLGSLYLEAVQNRDYVTIMAMMLLTAVAVLLSNLLADVAYAVADPRVPVLVMATVTTTRPPDTGAFAATRSGPWRGAAADGVAGATRRSQRSLWRRFIRHRLAVLGSCLLTVLVLASLFAPLLATHDPNKIDLRAVAQPPSSAHWLGTDLVGRDVYSRLLFAGRVSLSVGLISVAIYIAIAIVVGGISGYFGGWVDSILMRLTDTVMCFPTLIIIISLVAIVGPSLWTMMVVIGVLGWPWDARLARGQTLSVREMEFVQAARSSGATTPRIIARHVLPSISGPLIVAATFGVAWTILLEATLSFLGLGVQEPTASWGNMLNAARAVAVIESMPWLWLPAGALIAISVLSINFIGDGLRDALDPRGMIR